MGKISVKYITFFLVISLLLACVAGCNGNKDVYGAASDFIKVSHPDKPNTNVFSDENYDVSGSLSGKSTGSKDKNNSSETTSGDTDLAGSDKNSGSVVSNGTSGSSQSSSGSDSSGTVSGGTSQQNQGGTDGSGVTQPDSGAVLGVLPSDAFDGSGTNIKDTPAPGDHTPAIEIQ